MQDVSATPIVLGQRIRHLRGERGLTLAQLGERVGRQPPYLSQLENGKREATLSLLTAIAEALGTDVADLLDPTPPTRRDELELQLMRAQQDPVYTKLGLPPLTPSAKLPDEALEHLIGLYTELKRQRAVRAQTPEEMRKGNAALRAEMRDRDNHFPDIERAADETLEAIGHDGRGPVGRSHLGAIAGHFGFSVRSVPDLPSTVRSLTDFRRRRVYIPQRDQLDSQAIRTVVLQALGHLALGHEEPDDFGRFLRQRVEANYFAGAVLVPERTLAPQLQAAKEARDLSIETIEETYNVSYEMAAHRFTNLATAHLGIQVHFVRSDANGIIWKAYENDGVPFPADVEGAIEGQRLCRYWATRAAITSEDRYSLHYQYTDTPAGTYWCVTRLDPDGDSYHAITVGCRFADAEFFRGRDTTQRAESRCPEGPCCRQPSPELASRWGGMAWPSPRPHSHVLAVIPAGRFPGVDQTEVYEFLERHAQAS